MLWARVFPSPYLKEVCMLMKTKLNPFCMLGCCLDSPQLLSLCPIPPPWREITQSHPGGMKRESLPLLGVCKTLFPFLQRLSISPLSQRYAVLNTSSPIVHGSGCVWFVTIEVVIFSYLSGLIEHCSVEQWHVKIWVYLALSNHLASEMGHRVTRPQGRLLETIR